MRVSNVSHSALQPPDRPVAPSKRMTWFDEKIEERVFRGKRHSGPCISRFWKVQCCCIRKNEEEPRRTYNRVCFKHLTTSCYIHTGFLSRQTNAKNILTNQQSLPQILIHNGSAYIDSGCSNEAVDSHVGKYADTLKISREPAELPPPTRFKRNKSPQTSNHPKTCSLASHWTCVVSSSRPYKVVSISDELAELFMHSPKVGERCVRPRYQHPARAQHRRADASRGAQGRRLKAASRHALHQPRNRAEPRAYVRRRSGQHAVY